jgi:hypothetical protein
MEMYPYYMGYIVILLASSVIGFLLLIRIWGVRSIPGTYGLMLAVGCATEWSLGYVMEIFSPNIAEKILWAKLQYFGISYVALAMFIFTMYYSGNGGWLTRTRTALLAIIASAGFALALTNEWHHMIWSAIQFTNGLPFGPLDIQHGRLFFFIVFFQYVLVAIITVLFFQIATRSQSLYQNQSCFRGLRMLCILRA